MNQLENIQSSQPQLALEMMLAELELIKSACDSWKLSRSNWQWAARDETPAFASAVWNSVFQKRISDCQSATVRTIRRSIVLHSVSIWWLLANLVYITLFLHHDLNNYELLPRSYSNYVLKGHLLKTFESHLSFFHFSDSPPTARPLPPPRWELLYHRSMTGLHQTSTCLIKVSQLRAVYSEATG